MLDQAALDSCKEKIQEEINSHDVVLYMKGSRLMPMCGFSQQVAYVLSELKVAYLDRNVLEDEILRQAIKEFSDWPTIPQLYVKGQFIGGCDIILEMYKSGELEELFEHV